MQDLDGVAAALNDPQLVAAQVTLEGHTDATVSDDYNLRLSRRRVELVVTYLVPRGVAGVRLRASGFGEHRAAAGLRAGGRPPAAGGGRAHVLKAHSIEWDTPSTRRQRWESIPRSCVGRRR